MLSFLVHSRGTSRAAVVGIVLTISLHLGSPRAFGLLLQTSYELSDMAEEAQIICTATVLSTQCQWKEDHRGRHIYTHVKLGIGRWIKGPARGPYLDLEVVGGTVGDTTELVSDTPIFMKGEQVLLFLKGSPLYVVGGIMGKVPVVADHVFWKGRWTPVSSVTRLPGLGWVQALGEPNDVPGTEPNEVAPKILAIEPNIASAGTDTPVTIIGAGFGNRGGDVEFFHYGASRSWTPTLSWSDTEIVCKVPGGWSGTAGSGPVTVTTSFGVSNGYPFRVTFGYGGCRWKGPNPMVSYYVNANPSDCEGHEAEVLAAVRAAAETWNATGASFTFQYGGLHANTDANENGISEIMWGVVSGPQVVAQVVKWEHKIYDWYGNIVGSRLSECDMVFNQDLPWSTDASDPLVSRAFDIQTIALHEFGHWLVLSDLYGRLDRDHDVDKVMFGEGAGGQLRRELHPYDVAGIHWSYPPSKAPEAPASIEYPSDSDDGVYTVRWSRCNDASGYELERSARGSEWILVYSGPHTWFDEVAAEGSYRYRVRASNTAGSSNWQVGDWNCTVLLLWGGSGEPNDPFLIESPEQLDRIGSHYRWWSKHFKLAADIDLSGYDGQQGRPSFHTIASGWPSPLSANCTNCWTGVFDGGDHTISNLTCLFDSQEFVGLFSRVGAPGVVKDLRLVNVRVKGDWEVGGLVGFNEGSVSSCACTGVVEGKSEVGGLIGSNYGTVIACYSGALVIGHDWIGGLVGNADEHSYISECCSSGEVKGGEGVGGVAGISGGMVIRCYSAGSVAGTDSVGALAGVNWGSVADCYSTGSVVGEDCVGGLVGSNGTWWSPGHVTTSYSIGSVVGGGNVGGLVGVNDVNSSATDCFWDRETSRCASSAGGTGAETGQMKDVSTYADAGWDFVGETTNGTEDIWCMPVGSYPRLAWEDACR